MAAPIRSLSALLIALLVVSGRALPDTAHGRGDSDSIRDLEDALRALTLPSVGIYPGFLSSTAPLQTFLNLQLFGLVLASIAVQEGIEGAENLENTPRLEAFRRAVMPPRFISSPGLFPTLPFRGTAEGTAGGAQPACADATPSQLCLVVIPQIGGLARAAAATIADQGEGQLGFGFSPGALSYTAEARNMTEFFNVERGASGPLGGLFGSSSSPAPAAADPLTTLQLALSDLSRALLPNPGQNNPPPGAARPEGYPGVVHVFWVPKYPQQRVNVTCSSETSAACSPCRVEPAPAVAPEEFTLLGLAMAVEGRESPLGLGGAGPGSVGVPVRLGGCGSTSIGLSVDPPAVRAGEEPLGTSTSYSIEIGAAGG